MPRAIRRVLTRSRTTSLGLYKKSELSAFFTDFEPLLVRENFSGSNSNSPLTDPTFCARDAICVALLVRAFFFSFLVLRGILVLYYM